MQERAAVNGKTTRGRVAQRPQTVVVIDEQPLWVSGLAMELERASFQVLATSFEPVEGLQLAQRLAPDAFVIALEMPHAALDGPELIRRARAALPQTRIIALSVHGGPLYERTARAAGADAFAVKTLSGDAIVRLIDARAAPQAGQARFGEDPVLELTPRELEILELVARGYRNGAIAKRLWVTEWTVKFHLANAYRKLGVSNRTEAARYLLDRSRPVEAQQPA